MRFSVLVIDEIVIVFCGRYRNVSDENTVGRCSDVQIFRFSAKFFHGHYVTRCIAQRRRVSTRSLTVHLKTIFVSVVNEDMCRILHVSIWIVAWIHLYFYTIIRCWDPAHTTAGIRVVCLDVCA